MGGGIGAWFLTNNRHVRFFDISYEMIRKGIQTVHQIIQKKQRSKRIKRHQGQLMMDKLSSGLTINGLATSDLVIEAAPETMSIKKEIFKNIESVVSKRCIIASNTSSTEDFI